MNQIALIKSSGLRKMNPLQLAEGASVLDNFGREAVSSRLSKLNRRTSEGKINDTSDLHNYSYVDQSCRNRHRVRCSIRTSCRPAPRRLDEVVSYHCGGDDPDRLLLSVSWFYAGNRSRADIVACLLALTIYARYSRQLPGHWRWIYVVGAFLALYFNVFVGIVQSFEKIPALKAMAPTQSEPPFKLTQLVVLALFVVLTFVAAIRFRPEPVRVQ
jgi:hypothetical protein